jgi:hypothetical protein
MTQILSETQIYADFLLGVKINTQQIAKRKICENLRCHRHLRHLRANPSKPHD